jgi:hypothetical protein
MAIPTLLLIGAIARLIDPEWLIFGQPRPENGI